MQTLDLSCVPQWVPIHGFWFPLSIDITCPHCARTVNVHLNQPTYDAIRRTMSGTGSCPGCAGTIHLWCVEPGPATDPSQMTCAGLLLYPPPRVPRQPIAGAGLLPPRLATAYSQAIAVFNARLWNVTASCCRQVLEAVARGLLPSYEVQESLGQNLKRLAGSIELKRPLESMAFIVRDGGKLTAHFDLTAEPDEHTARLMLDLTEYLLTYTYTLPKLTEQLRQKLERKDDIVRQVRRAS
jgi:hypothetical protein